jgi:hypothetical protein
MRSGENLILGRVAGAFGEESPGVAQVRCPMAFAQGIIKRTNE